MATVTSITAERAEAIHNASITGAFLSGNNLILRTRGGSEINVGAVKANVLDAWPVGSVFIGYTATSPATLLGGGTWARIAEGRTLLGQTGADVDFDTLGDVGGEKNHTLTIPELPSHDHGALTGTMSSDHSHGVSITTGNAGNHQHNVSISNQDTRAVGSQAVMVPGGGPVATTVAGDHNHSVVGNTGGVSSNHQHGIAAQGGGGAHNNMPPYVVVYIWRRVS